MELREIDGTSLCCQFFVVNQRICPAFILSAAQRGRSGGSSSSREARHGGDFIPLLEGPCFGCLQPLHLREREKHLRCPFSPSALRLCRPRVRLLALLPFRLPCFWSAWLDMLQVVKTRSDLLYIMNSTPDTCFRNLFWISLANHMNEVGVFSPTHAFSLRSLRTSHRSCFPNSLAGGSSTGRSRSTKTSRATSRKRSTSCSRTSPVRSAASSKPAFCRPPRLFPPRFTQKRAEELVCLSHSAQQLHPSSLAACFVAACSLHLQGSFQQAAELYQHVVRQNPQHSLAWGLLGQLYAPSPVST